MLLAHYPRVIRATIMATLLAGPSAFAADFTPPPANEILETLKPQHPRLLITAEDVPGLKKLIRNDPLAGQIYDKIKKDADRTLEASPSKYEIPDGRRLLSVSRRVKDRVRTLAFTYLIEGDRRYVDRAWAELEAAAKFKDWNPSHFLDTAEMTHALALGYDWLYDQWTDPQRKLLRAAIVEKGLQPATGYYQPKLRSWADHHNNWNQVCNGGIGMGALAVADVEPELAALILHGTLRSLPIAMNHYAPDGAGTEGVTYWDYGARYNTLYLAALHSALGTDFGVSEIPAFGLSGDYQLYMSGADGDSLNFADCGLTRTSTPQHFWIARRYGQPRHAWFRHSTLSDLPNKGSVLDLLWYNLSGRDFDVATLPLEKHFRVADCVSMRSAWGDPEALVLGIQAGKNDRHDHRHIEVGSFILEALGVRWAVDLGTERQTYMRHQHSFGRWDFYRTRAEGQNTLVMNPGKGPDQKVPCKAPVLKFESAPEHCTTVVDLSEAFADHAKRVHRRFEMVDRRSVTITDDINAPQPIELWWFMHTQADVDLDANGRGATLTQDGKRLRVEIAGPADAQLAVMAAQPLPTSPNPDIQADNDNYRKLAIHFQAIQDLQLIVKLLPQWE